MTTIEKKNSQTINIRNEQEDYHCRPYRQLSSQINSTLKTTNYQNSFKNNRIT